MEIYIFIIGTLALSAFFSGTEIAFLASNKLIIELKKEKGGFLGKVLGFFNNNSGQFLGTTLVGNNIALVMLGIFMSALLAPYTIQNPDGLLPSTWTNELGILLVQTLITTVVVLIFGEFLPKAMFRLRPISLLTFFSLPLMAVYIILYPFVILVMIIVRFIMKYLLQTEYVESKTVFSKVDLQHLVSIGQSEDTEEGDLNTEIFENALHLNDVKVRECMVPRTEIDGIELSSSMEDLVECFTRTRHSRIIIYKESIDNILGYIHHFDVFTGKGDIPEMIITLPIVPETMNAREVLAMLNQNQKSMALVVDEFGAVAGIVTMEDVLEEIFGEIEDEHDTEEGVERQISDNQFIFSGRMEIDYLNEKYGLNLEEGEYETLSGFILDHFEKIPEMDEELELEGFIFKILRVSQNKIETVKLTLGESPDGNS